MNAIQSHLKHTNITKGIKKISSTTQSQIIGDLWWSKRLIFATFGSIVITSGAYGTHWGLLFCSNDCGGIPAVTGQPPANGLHVDVIAGQIFVTNGAGGMQINPQGPFQPAVMVSTESPIISPQPDAQALWVDVPNVPPDQVAIVYSPFGNDNKGAITLLPTDGKSIDATAAIKASGASIDPWTQNCSMSGTSTYFNVNLQINLQGGRVLPSTIQCTAGSTTTTATVSNNYAAGPISISSPCSSPDEPVSCSLSPSGVNTSPEHIANASFLCGPQGP